MIYVFFYIFLIIIVQIILKKESNIKTNSESKSYLLNMITSPKVVCAYLISGIGILVWIIALSKVPLLFATVLSSCSYALMLLADKIFFNVTITKKKIQGTVLIVIGVIMYIV